MSGCSTLEELWEIIGDRARHPSEESYVSGILTHRKGVDKALEKVGEECTEFLLAAKNTSYERKVSETADLVFHILVALKALDIELDDIFEELESRRR
ncbi:MAG TPA: phosphoribosyl-ATP diphosphatase [Methanoculleus sp.]|nr:phosphoribosyl-ATP diphosphatase [Methanoculleus sp.]